MVTIHRDRTFEYNGEQYRTYRLGPYGSGDSVWEINRVSDGRAVEETFDNLADVRRFLNESESNGWDLLTGQALASAVTPLPELEGD